MNADTYHELRDALNPDVWETVSRRLLAKMLAEFAYEEIVRPERVGDSGGSDGDRSTYRVELAPASYRYEAEERMLNSYHVFERTIERCADDDGWEPATDPVRFLRDLQRTVDIDGLTGGNLVREYKRTLLADAHIEARDRERDGFDPTEFDYARLEGEMTGHPWITYNKGRLGWGYEDYRRYAPERREPIALSWAAVRKSEATYVSVEGLDHERLLREELGDRYGVFRDRLDARGLDPDAYYFLPVHDWQWDRSIVALFPGAVANDEIVPLGEGPDEYLPQQSVRTFVDVDDESKRHVKLPMRILNTLVWRGLPGERTEIAPTITEYVKDIYERDEFLQERDVILPGEVAGVNYDHEGFAGIDDSPYQYRELLGAVWRESTYEFLESGESAITLSALMHVDGEGVPYLSRLVERSDLTLDEWLAELFETLLPPLLHFLYRYGTAFSPHGQNTIVVVEEGVPTRVAVKDFADDVNVSDRPLPELERLSDDLRGVLRKEDPDGLTQFIFSGLFVCVLRYVADVLEIHEDYPEEKLWGHVRRVVCGYQRRFPELEERFETFDLLKPEFTRLSLNRNRLLEYGYDDAPGRPHASEHGTVPNPLHRVARGESNADD